MSDALNDPVPPCFAAPGSAADRLTQMFVEMGQAHRIAAGQCPAERSVFRKVHGVAHGVLERLSDGPAHLQTGLFAQDRLSAWVRFSSDTTPTAPDVATTLGIGIKVFGLAGPTVLDQHGTTADLIMQNHDVFFVDDAAQMVQFTYAGVVQRDYSTYLRAHPKTAGILADMARPEGSVLTAHYWAILPFMSGRRIVKYRLSPTQTAWNVPDDAAGYLGVDLARRLRERDYEFRLEVQERTHPQLMPLDEATVRWPEDISPWVPIARLRLPRQDIHERGQRDYGQSLSFNIWRVPPSNAPSTASSLAVARRDVYAAGARMRHTANGQPVTDPQDPRPADAPARRDDNCIVAAVIYPSIGIARVGNSPDEYFIGPEVNQPDPAPPGSYRDQQGRLKRQAARFRIYGVNAAGDIVRELLPGHDQTQVTWRTELANTKSAWYGFQLALDVPEADATAPTTLRNPSVTDRAALSITPGPRSITGPNAEPVAFDTGTFMGENVYLGELRTDENGRLIVLGGHGISASYDGSLAITFANNERWHDDVSDGPVTADVTIDGVPLPVVPAWVVVAPPDYAPARKSIRTMWDLMRDLAITAGALLAPRRPSFTDDILPIFYRMSGLQWVNAGFAAGFGWHGAFDLTSPAALARLADPSPAQRSTRHTITRMFRSAAVDGASPTPWPWVYGDAMNQPPVDSSRQHAFLSDTQMRMLHQWSDGDFDADWDPDRIPPKSLDEVPLREQGDMLTRAALEFTLADAFHPGCEMTWPVRSWSMYCAPFRFKHADPTEPVPSLGAILTYESASMQGGPLTGQRPGSLTRWMAVPWQTDTASCRSGYDRAYDPYLPTFWPATVPNQVLTTDNYATVTDTTLPLEHRQTAFANRAAWIEPLGAVGYTSQINNMIAHFDHLGVVETRDGPPDGDFPDHIEVEDRHTPVTAEPDETLNATPGRLGSPSGSNVSVRHETRPSAADVDVSGIDKVRRFPQGLRGLRH